MTDLLLALSPFIVWGLIWLWWRWWSWSRRRSAAPQRRRWPSVVLVGPPQPQGQAALVSDDVAVGQEVYVSGDQWRVSDVEDLPTGLRRAWLVNVSEDVRVKLELAARRQLAEQLRVELDDLVRSALEPFWGREWRADAPDVLNFAVRRALCEYADRLRLVRYGVTSSADLPPRLVWPEVRAAVDRNAPVGAIVWDVRQLADALAHRAR